MKAWVSWAAIGILAMACGGNDEACAEADAVALKIRNAAEADGIDHEGICASGARERLAFAGFSPSQVEARAAQYAEACAEYQKLADECGD